MKKLTLLFLAFLSMGFTNQEICQAIYFAEGGLKAEHPFGVDSCLTYQCALKVCLNTVSHKNRDYQDHFLDYLSTRYCPKHSKTWLKNVKFFLGRENAKAGR